DINQGQVVTFTYFIVIEVMSGGDLDAAGTKLTVYIIVSNDRDQAVHQRQYHKLADKRLVTLIFRMDSNRTVTEHVFRAGGGYNKIVIPVGGCGFVSEGVEQMSEMAFITMVFHVKIGDSGMQFGVQVHQTIAAVDQTTFVQPNISLLYGMLQSFI